MRIVVVLPAPFGPSTPYTRAGPHREVDAVDGARLAEHLDEAFGLDGQFGTHGELLESCAE